MPFVPRELTPAQVLLILAGLVILLALVLPGLLYLRAMLRRWSRRGAVRRSAGVEIPMRERIVTVGVVNVRGWVTASVRPEGAALLGLQRTVADVVVEAVRKRGGMMIKDARGDAVFAFNALGDPVATPGHIAAAVLAAAEIGERCGAGQSELKVHIGVASGHALAGNIGGGGFEVFQVRGATVDHATRLAHLPEAHAPNCILIDHATAAELPAGFRAATFDGSFSRDDAVLGVHVLQTAQD